MEQRLILWLSLDPTTQCWRTVDTGCSDSSLPLWGGPWPQLTPFPLLSWRLCLIKKHLLAIHCISEQNLYFRHVETWIPNLNTNVAGCPYYSIPFYLSIIAPSRIEHVDRCKWVMKMQGPKNNRRKLNSLILIKSCFGKAELKAEGAAKSSSCLTITPDLLYYVLEKEKKKASFIKFLYSCLHPKLNGKFEESSSGVFQKERTYTCHKFEILNIYFSPSSNWRCSW